MQYILKKKIFNVGTPSKKVGLSIPKTMHEALEFVSKETNQSIPQVIVDVLEEYLTHLLESKQIPLPDTTKEKAS